MTEAHYGFIATVPPTQKTSDAFKRAVLNQGYLSSPISNTRNRRNSGTHLEELSIEVCKWIYRDSV